MQIIIAIMAFLKNIEFIILKHKIKLIGCSEREVAEIENKLGFELPEAYREYLLSMGKNAGELICGDTCSYDDIIFNQSEGREIYYNATNKELQSTYFIFLTHQYYSFYCFNRIENEEDPNLWIFVDGDDGDQELRNTGKKISDYLSERISRHLGE